MKILSRSLKSRFDSAIDVGLYEEFTPGNIRHPAAWVVTSADHPGKEGRFATLAAALTVFNRLCAARQQRAPGRYAVPRTPAVALRRAE